MPASPIVLALYLLTVVICLLAISKGGLPERWAGGIILGNIALARLGMYVLPPGIDAVVGLTADGITAAGLLMITLIYPNPWLGGTMLLYAAQFTLHSFYFVTERPHDRFHVMANNLDFLGISICLAAGTGLAWRARARRSSP
jgi:hypothetical protein